MCPFLKDRAIRRVQWAAREVAMATILLCTTAQAAKGQEEGEPTHTLYVYMVYMHVRSTLNSIKDKSKLINKNISPSLASTSWLN